MENLSSYPEWSVILSTLHKLLSYAVKDRLTFEISSREHHHQKLVMYKYEWLYCIDCIEVSIVQYPSLYQI